MKKVKVILTGRFENGYKVDSNTPKDEKLTALIDGYEVVTKNLPRLSWLQGMASTI